MDSLCCIGPDKCKMLYFKSCWPKIRPFWICRTAEKRYLEIFSISNILNYNYVDAVDSLHCISPERCKMQKVFGPKFSHFELFQKSERRYPGIIYMSNILNHNYIDVVDSLCIISPEMCKMPYFWSFWPKSRPLWFFFKNPKECSSGQLP